MLNQGGYQTMDATTGEDGIDMARQNHPDLILMDVVMPGMNGFQATREIRKHPNTEDIPIIMVSGNQQGTDLIWGSRLGANDFLPKPVSRRDLFQKVESLLNLNPQAA
jgi:twitching motility two-component system response regulator PilH